MTEQGRLALIRGRLWRRWRTPVIWVFIVLVPWVPGAVTLAMLLSGHAEP